MTTYSPLRYPGGKAQLYNLVCEIFDHNNLKDICYIEPFVGGAGLAMKLLLENKVQEIILNDFDVAIYSFWYSILNYTHEFCELIEKTPITIEEWHKQKETYKLANTSNILEFGFSTFFLNRTNMSGIIKGGVIGGKNQNGNYKLDARFHKQNLIKKINLIASKKEHIKLYNLDAIEFLSLDFLNENENLFINLDPPYVKKGYQLYTNFFTEENHIDLSNHVKKLTNNWIITYDTAELIKTIYSDFRGGRINLNYCIGSNKQSNEYIFFSNKLIIPKNCICLQTFS